MKKEKKIYESSWYVFYFALAFDLSFEICGYFDNRPRFNICLIFFRLTLILPFRNKWTDECDSPKWGISIHNNTFWVHKGGKGNMNGGNKWWTWSIPFITKEWVRTSVLLKNGNWESESLKNRKDFYNKEWKEKQESITYNYTDKCDGEIIPTTIYVDEREWRPKWLKWTKLFRTVRRSIDVHFDKQVGKRKGSWKGGCTGCSYTIKGDETPLECLKRMEIERDF